MSGKPSGRRIENFSSADIVAHGREARRKRRPIWTEDRAARWWRLSRTMSDQVNNISILSGHDSLALPVDRSIRSRELRVRP